MYRWAIAYYRVTGNDLPIPQVMYVAGENDFEALKDFARNIDIEYNEDITPEKLIGVINSNYVMCGEPRRIYDY